MGEVDGLDFLTGLVEDLLQLQRGGLEVVRQGGEVGRRQGGEKPVANGGLFYLGHALPAVLAGAYVSLSRRQSVVMGDDSLYACRFGCKLIQISGSHQQWADKY